MTAGARPVGSWLLDSSCNPCLICPKRELVAEQVHVFRECAADPCADVRISGTLHKTGASADGTVVFKVPEARPIV